MKKINKITMFTAVAIIVASVCTNGIMYAIDNPAEKEITGNNNRYYGEMPADNSNSTMSSTIIEDDDEYFILPQLGKEELPTKPLIKKEISIVDPPKFDIEENTDIYDEPAVDQEEETAVIEEKIEKPEEETKPSVIENTDSYVMKAGEKTKYKYGNRINPSVDITVPDSSSSMKNYTGEVDVSSYTYLGDYKITGYTPGCTHCCGNNKGIGASGVKMINGYSVATHKDIPFGTTLYIEGYGYYVVEDRGVGRGVIDISAPTHDQCYDLTKSNVGVYIVE